MSYANSIPYDRREMMSETAWLAKVAAYIERMTATLATSAATRGALEIPPAAHPRPGPWQGVVLEPLTPEIAEQVELQRLISFVDAPGAPIYVATAARGSATWIRQVGTREKTYAVTGTTQPRRILVELVETGDAAYTRETGADLQSAANECLALFYRDVAERCTDWWECLGLELPTEAAGRAWLSFVAVSLIDRAKVKRLERSREDHRSRVVDGKIDDLRSNGDSLNDAVKKVHGDAAKLAADGSRGRGETEVFADKRRDYRKRFSRRLGKSLDPLDPQQRSAHDEWIIRSHIQEAVARWPHYVRNSIWVQECNHVTGHFIDEAEKVLRCIEDFDGTVEQRRQARTVAEAVLHASRAAHSASEDRALTMCFPDIYEAVWRKQRSRELSLALLQALASTAGEDACDVISDLTSFIEAFRSLAKEHDAKLAETPPVQQTTEDLQTRQPTPNAVSTSGLVQLFVAEHSSAVRLATGVSTESERTNLLSRAAARHGERWETTTGRERSFPHR